MAASAGVAVVNTGLSLRQRAVLHAVDEALAYEGRAPRAMIAHYLTKMSKRSPFPAGPVTENQLKDALRELRKEGLLNNSQQPNGSSHWSLTPQGMRSLDSAIIASRTAGSAVQVAPGPRSRTSALADRR